MEFSHHSRSNSAAAAAVRKTILPEPTTEPASTVIDIRSARVIELREQYLSGTLQVDPAKLAADIVAKHLKK